MAAADGLSFSHLDAAVRTQTVERVLGHVRFAAEIGSAVTIGSLSGRLGDCDVWERLGRRAAALESLGQLCKQARNAGVTVLLEPLNRYEGDYINRLADVVKIAEDIGADNLKLLADTFHMNIEEPDVCQSLRTAGPWIGHVHLADTNREAPGHGHLNVVSVLEALDSIAYEGFLSFEILRCRIHSRRSTTASKRFARHWTPGRIDGLPAPGRRQRSHRRVGLLHGLEARRLLRTGQQLRSRKYLRTVEKYSA